MIARLIVSLTAVAMIGVVADASQLRDLLKQCLFNAALQVHRPHTALTAATELQHRKLVFCDLDQRHLTPVRS